jgi:CRP/FNR family transcriptional regulator, cyclic AMP receptor protein
VWRLETEKYVKFLREHVEVLPPLLDLIIEMYQMHSERIINLEYRSVRERLISFLLTMSGRFGTKVEGGMLIDVPLKHQDIASSINASRETTNRELSRLEQKELVATEQSRIILKDIKKLRSFL